LKSLKENLNGDEWLRAQWEFLESLGLDEFSGCDIDILPILEQIPVDAEEIDVQCFLQHTLVESLHERLEMGGNSILLDIDKMKETPASILIPRITELRKKELDEVVIQVVGKELIIYDVFMRELERTVIPDKGETVVLDELWLTAHGYRLLTSLGFGRRTDMKGLRKIQSALQNLDAPPKIEYIIEPKKVSKSNISSALSSLILERAGS